jgi:ABC-type Fe3+-hydroxamate transport system substrate-binding protein
MGEGALGKIRGRRGWENIPAVKNGRVYHNLKRDVVYRLGPRMLEGIKEIKKCLYP